MQQTHEEAMEYLRTAAVSERNLKFRQAVNALDYRHITAEDANVLRDIYFKLKDMALRNQILGCFMHLSNPELGLGPFFQDAYKKERYLDMKLKAVRGLANYATEPEIERTMKHFTKLLMKRPEHTPYNYQEYEFLRSACGLPYLIKKYGYACFEQAFMQEEQQYNDMPDAFKGHHTYDEVGNFIVLRSAEEVQKMLNKFFAAKRSNNESI
ncbi:hypothetical protein EJP77_10355 [Paenibacillus zeisoli]|uniref:Uncharacterized protein n=1 Tax=Paenibacillus zeisoli TaxID=2496267 RepID=A0A433XCB5_9BACL|nr:hypothetical protein [Paenibacillus zeisoli]RUT31779.1 hypothetical protein EJP77_10355 [Paenibacillus zeisoli]